jgi:steroid delta-isomerase-like uncharacterized protein
VSTNANKDLIRRFYTTIDRDGTGAADPFLTQDCAVNMTGAPGQLDRETFKQFGAGFYAAFPDLRHNVEDMVAEGDRLVARLRVTGTHRGDLMGIAASGRPVDFGAISAFTIRDGQVAAISVAIDMLAMLQQVGAVPATAGAPA